MTTNRRCQHRRSTILLKRLGTSTVIALIGLVITTRSQAEYRAYRHQISDSKGSVTVVSTLDPTQYANQHLAGQWDSVILEKTWMCYGRTSDFAAICPPPPD